MIIHESSVWFGLHYLYSFSFSGITLKKFTEFCVIKIRQIDLIELIFKIFEFSRHKWPKLSQF